MASKMFGLCLQLYFRNELHDLLARVTEDKDKREVEEFTAEINQMALGSSKGIKT